MYHDQAFSELMVLNRLGSLTPFHSRENIFKLYDKDDALNAERFCSTSTEAWGYSRQELT